MGKKTLVSASMTIFLLAFLFVPPASAVGGTVQRIVVQRTLNGSTGDVIIYNSGWLTQRVDFDVEYGVRVTVYASGGSADWYYQLRNDVGYNETWTGSSTSHAFYPWPPIEGDYMAFVDGNTPGEFTLRALYPDLEASTPSPDNGGSSSPFCVGQEVDWYTTVTNQGDGEAESTSVGYYIGTSSSDFSNRVNSDSTGILAPNGGSSTQHDAYTFTAGDVGTRYSNVWADYSNEEEEDDENDNRSSYGPFQVIAVPSAPSLSSPANGSSICSRTPAFSWGSVSGAASYRIQVDDSSTFSSPEVNQTTSGTSYTPGPPLAPGTHYWRVQASNACGTGSWSATWSFTIPPAPSPPSLSSPADGSSTCDATPTFSWSSASGATAYRIQVDDSSTFSSPEISQATSGTSYTPGSALAPGTYYWRVESSSSCSEGPSSATWSVTILSTPGAPSLSSPANGSTVNDDTPTFSWGSVSGATSYRIQVDNNSTFSSPEIDQTSASTSYTPGTALASGTYYWRVQASNSCGAGSWSATWQLTVDTSCPTPPAPSLSSPSNGSSTCDTTPTFSWGSVSGATSYRIQVDNNSTFSSPEVNQTTTGTSYTPEGALAPGTTYWRVQASNGCGDGAWSATWSVTILSTPGTPSLSSPANGSTVNDDTPTFTWGSVSGATSYRIQVDNNSTFSSPEINQTTTGTSYTPGSALASGTYYWRVQASNACGTGSWSATWQVTIETSCPTPPAPSLSSPANGSSTCDTTPTFSWGSVSGATSYRIQVDNNSTFASPEVNQTTSGTSYTPGSALAPGTTYWRVRASNSCGNGPWSATRSVTILSAPGAPSLSSPSNGSTISDDTPTFNWGSVSGASSYRIQVDDNSTFSSPEINQTTSGTSYTPGSALAAGTYYWRVRASNSCGTGSWSATWHVTISCPTPPAPSLSSPSNGSSTCDTTPAFSWSSVSGASSYRIQVDNNSTFSSPAINRTTSGTSYTPGSALSPGVYYWRVRASNACGDGAWSSSRNVTIRSTPAAPSLSSPSNGSNTYDTTPAFSWGSVSGASSYRIQVDNSSTFSSPEINRTTSSTSYTPGTALAAGTYYWRVRASNSCGDGPWSSHRYFAITPLSPPEVQAVRPCIGGPFYFEPWLPVSNRYEAQMDWQGHTAAYAEFALNGRAVRENTSGNTASHTYDLGRDLRFGRLGTRNTLETRAVAADGARSSPYVLHPIGIANPSWLPFDKMKEEVPSRCTGEPMKAQWNILYPEEPFTGDVTPPSVFPFIGGQTFGLKRTQAGLQAKFAGDGTGSAKLSGQTGFRLAGQEVNGIAYGKGEGVVQQGEGINLEKASFGLEVQGTIKAKKKLVDLICDALTGGACLLDEAEDWPIIGGLVRWFNDRAWAQAKLEPGVGLTFNFLGDQSGLRWKSGTGTGKVKITLSLIVEANSDLTAEAYGGGEPSITLQVPANPSYLKKVAADLFAGVRLKAWGLQREFERSYEWSYSPSSYAALAHAETASTRILKATDWHPIPRDYAANPATYALFQANAQPLHLASSPAALHNGTGLLATEENLIASNVFPESHPAIAADGNVLLLWVHDDVNKPVMQGHEIYYSVYNGATWSSPAGITDDNLEDFSVQVAFDSNDNAVAVWERNKTVQSASSEFNADYANGFEIAYSVWNGSGWSAPLHLTNNDALDHAPVLARGNDGTLLLIWRQSATGELLGTSTKPDTLLYALWDGTTWSTPQVLLSDVAGITGLTAARHERNTMAVVYSQDTDGDTSTAQDQELFTLIWGGSVWSAPTRLTNDTEPDNRPTLFYDASGVPRLLWLKGDTLYALLGSLAGTPQTVTVEGSAAILGYSAAQDTDGDLVLLWQGYSDEGVDAFYATYDEAHDLFSLVEQLTHDEPLEKFMAPTFAPTGEMVMAYNKTALVTETVTVSSTLVIDNVTTFGQTDIYVLRHTFGPDLAVETSDLTVDPANPTPGTVARIHATVHNPGDRAAVNPKVAFYLGDPDSGGTPIGTVTANLTLGGGMTTTVEIDWTVPSSGGPFAVYALADPDGTVDELNEANNKAHFFAAVPDLVVHDVRVAYGSGQVITLTATVSNTGVVAASDVPVAFRLDDPETGTGVAQSTVASLAAGEETQVQTTWDIIGVSAGRYKVHTVADPANLIVEADEENNADWAGAGVLPDLALRSGMVVTDTNVDGTQAVSVWVFNEGQRDANSATLGLYRRMPVSGTMPLVSTVLSVPAGEYRVADLNLGDYEWGFYAAVAINGEVEDRDVSNNVLRIGEMPPGIYLPLVLQN